MGLSGRRIFVVGVGPGLGSATAYMLLKEGAEVVIAARERAKISEISKRLSRYGKVSYVVGDATSAAGAKRMIASAKKKLGRIDDLVITVGNYIQSSISDIKEDQMKSMIEVNLNAPLYLINAAIPSLKEGCSIVMVSAVIGMFGNPTKDVAYATSKAALAKATEVIASELLPKGIRVNSVAPRSMKGAFEPGSNWRSQRRLGDIECPPEDVANVIVFLLSKESEWINGTVIPVDGGSRFRR